MEKDIKTQRVALEYLKKQVENAHKIEDIGKVRHLSFLALRKFVKPGEIPLIEIEDIAWAFIYGINWALKDFEFQTLFKSYELFVNKHHGVQPIGPGTTQAEADKTIKSPKFFEPDEKYPQRNLISFLIKFLKFDLKDKDIDKYITSFKSIGKEFLIKNETKNSISFPLIIGILWFLRPNERTWENICNKWIECLKEDNANKFLLNELKNIRDKIKIFQWLFHPDYKNNNKPDGLIIFFNDDIIANIFRCINAYLSNDTKQFYNFTKKLAASVNYGEEYFAVVQSLINLATLLKELRNNYEGILRYNRFMLENQYRLFKKNREAEFDLKLYRAEKEKGEVSARLHCQRLILLMHLANIRDFDFFGYNETMKRQMNYSFHIGSFRGIQRREKIENYFLFIALDNFLNVVFSEKIKNDLIENSEFELELTEDCREHIHKLLYSSLNSHPCNHNRAIRLLRIISDAVPEDDKILNELAEWTIKYPTFERPPNFPIFNTIDHSYLNFWKEIIENLTLSRSVWKKLNVSLEEYIDDITQYEYISYLLKIALIKAPPEFSGKWLNNIKQMVSNKKRNINRMLPTVIISASVQNQNLLSEVIEIIKSYTQYFPDDLGTEYKLRYLECNLNEEIFRQNYQELIIKRNQEELRKLIEFCDKIRSEYIQRQKSKSKSRSIGMGGYDDWHFEYIYWSDMGEKIEDKIIKKLKEAFKSDPDEGQVKVLFKAMMALFQEGNKKIRQGLLEIIVPFWKKPPTFYRIKDFASDSPFSTFRVKSSIENYTLYRLMVIGARWFIYADAGTRNLIMQFALRYQSSEELYSNHISAIYFYGILFGEDNRERQIALNSLTSYTYQTIRELQSQNGITNTIYNILSDKVYPLEETGLELLKRVENHEEIFEFIFSWLDEIHWKPMPELRRNVALLTRFFLDNGFESNERLNNIREKLTTDVRARVRNVFKN